MDFKEQSKESLTQREVGRIDAALKMGKEQEGQKEPSETDKLRTEMMQMMKTFAEAQQKMSEENAALRAELKYATLAAQQPRMAPAPFIPQLPADLKEGQEVTYINHAGRAEHGVVQEISDVSGTVILEIHGTHENDVQRVADVKFGDKLTRNTFTLAPPPGKPKTSLPKNHPKGLQVPVGS